MYSIPVKSRFCWVIFQILELIEWFFSAICVLVISFRATSIQHYLFFLIILQSIIWKSSSFYSLVCRIFLFIHYSTSLLSSTFLELQCILNTLLTKPWRDQEVQIESCPDYPRSYVLKWRYHPLAKSLWVRQSTRNACYGIVHVMCAHCCLTFQRFSCRFSWKRIIGGFFISQILS